MGSHAALVDQVKGLQRTNEAAKQAWWQYADTALQGIRDPSRHDEHKLSAFLRQYQAGGMVQPAAAAYGGGKGAYGGAGAWSLWPQVAAYMGMGGGGGGGGGLAGGIKEGQRRSQVWREAWQKFCAVKGRAYNDPTRHSDMELVDFLEYAGEVASAGLDTYADQEGVDLAGRGLKRAAPASDWEPAAKRRSGGADSEKTSLVVKVKELQRSSQEMKQAWWTYCDESLGGVRDPNRHDAAVLSQFLAAMGAA